MLTELTETALRCKVKWSTFICPRLCFMTFVSAPFSNMAASAVRLSLLCVNAPQDREVNTSNFQRGGRLSGKQSRRLLQSSGTLTAFRFRLENTVCSKVPSYVQTGEAIPGGGAVAGQRSLVTSAGTLRTFFFFFFCRRIKTQSRFLSAVSLTAVFSNLSKVSPDPSDLHSLCNITLNLLSGVWFVGFYLCVSMCVCRYGFHLWRDSGRSFFLHDRTGHSPHSTISKEPGTHKHTHNAWLSDCVLQTVLVHLKRKVPGYCANRRKYSNNLRHWIWWAISHNHQQQKGLNVSLYL